MNFNFNLIFFISLPSGVAHSTIESNGPTELFDVNQVLNY